MIPPLPAHVVGADPATLADGGAPPAPLLPVIAVAAVGWLAAVWLVDRAHPANPVPVRRTTAWLGALAIVAVALLSPLDELADAASSSHMVQHLLLTFVAAPLLVLAAPVTLLLRVSRPGARRRWLIPLLHGRAAGVVTHPALGWLAFIVVMWLAHLGPLAEAALESPRIHELEHVLLLGSACLFWLPIVAADPVRHRLGWSAKVAFVGLAMPFMSLLGMVLASATEPLYPHYVALAGPAAALADQRVAGSLMWVGMDAAAVVVIAAITWSWLRADETPMRPDPAGAPGAEAASAR